MIRPFKKFTLYDESQETFSTNSTMADVNNPKKGDNFYFYRSRCTVIGETLKPGNGNIDEAVVQIETAAGTPYMFLYKESARYLSEKAVSVFGKWPLTPASSR